MAVCYLHKVAFEYRGEPMSALALSGRQAAEVIALVDGIKEKGDQEVVAVAAQVTAWTLLDGGDLAFGKDASAEIVLDSAANSLIMATFEAVMDDAGLKEDAATGPPLGNLPGSP